MTYHYKVVDTSSESLSPSLLTISDRNSDSFDYENYEDRGFIGEFMISSIYSYNKELSKSVNLKYD